MSAELVPFVFAGRQVRTVMRSGEPWFVVADVCQVLGILNSRDVVAKNLPKSDVAKIYMLAADGKKRELTFVNEPGLYRLILRSNKAEAERFQDWICREVLPSIRRTGQYLVDVSNWVSPICISWRKTFPDLYYEHVFRLKGKNPVPLVQAPWLAQTTNEIVYSRLDEGVLEALDLINPVVGRWRKHKQHQHISPGDARQQFDNLLGNCVGMMASFSSWEAFIEAWNKFRPPCREIPDSLTFKYADNQLLMPFVIVS